MASSRSGWVDRRSAPRPTRGSRRRLGSILLLLPLVVGLLGAPAIAAGVSAATSCPTPRRTQAQLKKEVAAQKAQVAELNACRPASRPRSRTRSRQLRGIGADLDDGPQEDRHDAEPRSTWSRPTTRTWSPSSASMDAELLVA